MTSIDAEDNTKNRTQSLFAKPDRNRGGKGYNHDRNQMNANDQVALQEVMFTDNTLLDIAQQSSADVQYNNQVYKSSSFIDQENARGLDRRIEKPYSFENDGHSREFEKKNTVHIIQADGPMNQKSNTVLSANQTLALTSQISPDLVPIAELLRGD